MSETFIYSSLQYNSSQLCKEESWEREYIPRQNNIAQVRTEKETSSCCDVIKKKLGKKFSDFKERCVTQFIVCKAKGCKCSTIYQKYFFWSKSIILLLILNTLFSTSIYGVTSQILKIILGPDYLLAHMLVICGATQLLFPLAGHIADTYIGRHNVIRFSLLSSWLSFGILGVSISIDNFLNDELNFLNRYILLPIVFMTLSVAYVCFMSNIIPFSLDQLQGASHIYYNSFFYWWYWSLILGAVIFHIPKYCSEELELGLLLQTEISLVCISIAVVLDMLLKNWFVIEPCCTKQGNPIRQIYNIILYIIKTPKKHIPSTVRHELDLSKCNRLDLAKKRFGGKYETEQIEDFRTFFSVLLILAAVGLFISSYSAVFNTIHMIQDHMINGIPDFSANWTFCDFKVSTLTGLNAGLLLVVIPALDLIIVPLLRHAMIHPSIRKRLGIGGLCALLSVLSLLGLEGIGDHYFSAGSDNCLFDGHTSALERNEISSYWLVLPMVLVTLAEIFINVPCFEFICAQAPYNMRGLLIGIFFSFKGLFALLSALIQYLFSQSLVFNYPFQVITGYSCTFWFYLILVCLTTLGVCFYSIVACKYKKRKRDDVFNQVGMIEEYFSSGRIHSSRWA